MACTGISLSRPQLSLDKHAMKGCERLERICAKKKYPRCP